MQVSDLSWWVESQHSGIEAALRELVEINTFTNNFEGVDEGMDALSKLAENMGFTVQTVEARHRLIRAERRTGEEKPPRVLLISHMDTVHAPEEGFLHYEPLGDGFVRGPGVGDIKGGLVMGLWAMKAVTELMGDKDYDVQMIVSADEERGSPTLRSWYTDRAQHEADYALGLEPGFPQGELTATVDLGVVYQRRGYAAIKFTVNGVPSHSGTPELGLSAIEAMALRIVKLQGLNDPARGISVNVGLVEGGTAPNTVAAEATATVSWRYDTMADALATQTAIEAIINEPLLHNERLGVEETTVYEVNTFIPTMERTAASQKLVEIVLEEATRLGQPVVPIQRGGGSDANHVSLSGVPSICGMGAPSQDIHTKKEKIYLPMLFERVNLLASTVYRIATERP